MAKNATGKQKFKSGILNGSRNKLANAIATYIHSLTELLLNMKWQLNCLVVI